MPKAIPEVADNAGYATLYENSPNKTGTPVFRFLKLMLKLMSLFHALFKKKQQQKTKQNKQTPSYQERIVHTGQEKY